MVKDGERRRLDRLTMLIATAWIMLTGIATCNQDGKNNLDSFPSQCWTCWRSVTSW